MNSKKLIKKLWKKFPLKLAKKYHDYVGLMVSKIKEETNKIIVCLDVNNDVIDLAINEGADLIISHHPFIYGKKKFVLMDEYKLNMYKRLEDANIPVYSFHTNFDEGVDGMNDALLRALDINNIRPIPNLEIGRMGELTNPISLKDFAKFALERLELDYGQIIGDENILIETIGIVGGSGSRDYLKAYAAGCDLFISGDTPYHIRKEIKDKKMVYLHLDHEVEKIFIKQMSSILLSFDSSLEVIEFNDVKQATLIVK